MDKCIRYLVHDFPIDLNDEIVLTEPISRANRDGTEFILLNQPDYIQHVFRDKDHIYRKEGTFVKILKMFVGHGVPCTEGKTWERQRQSIRPAFGKQSLDQMMGKMSDVTINTINELDRHLEDSKTVDIHYDLNALTLKIIAEALFSEELTNETVKALLDAEKIASMTTAKLFTLSEEDKKANTFLYDQFSMNRKIMDNFANELIEKRRKSSVKQNDLLQLLLDSQEQNKEITDEEIRDQCLTLLNGAHDTCAQTLTWACYLLSQNKDIEEKIRQDVNQNVGNRRFELSDYEKITWPQMMFKETLRLFPPAHIMERTPITDDWIGDIKIPAHANVAISPWVTHRNANYWENPFMFDPTRFSPTNPVNPAFIPFGGGPRVCIGQGLAMREGALILAALTQRYSFELPPKQRVQAYGSLTLIPRFGLKLILNKV